MTIKTLWGWRRGENVPELMEAWDEYSVDDNPDGFEQACERAIASWGSDLYAHRYIDLEVSREKISRAFAPVTVETVVGES